FGGTLDILQVQESPATKLRAIREIGIFGERVVLPAAGVLYGFAAPDARGAVEIKETPAAGACTMLDNEMAVEENTFDFRERGVITVEIRPAGLHHGQTGIAEIGQSETQKIGAGLEIGVEDGDELAAGRLQPLGQGTRLVALAIRTMQITHFESQGAIAFDTVASDFLGLIGGIVENLHLEQTRRIIQARNRLDQPLDNVALVVDWKLYSYLR